MSWFDIIVSIILLLGFVKGAQKGLVMQLAGLVAIIIAAIFAGKAAKIILPFLLNNTNISISVATVISYISTFTAIVFAVRFVGKMLHGLFEAIHINFLNKILGAIIGVASTMIVLSILLNLAIMLDPKEELITRNIKSETYFYSKIQVVVPAIVPYLKKDLLEQYIPEQLKDYEDYDDEEEVSNDFPEKLYT